MLTPMNVKELRQLTPEALRAKATELRAEIRGFLFRQQQEREKNVKKLRTVRHELARVLTILTERERTSLPPP